MRACAVAAGSAASTDRRTMESYLRFEPISIVDCRHSWSPTQAGAPFLKPIDTATLESAVVTAILSVPETACATVYADVCWYPRI